MNKSNSNGIKKLKRFLIVFYVVCAIAFAVDPIIHIVAGEHETHPWALNLFFYCVFGFVACVLLVLIAKVMRVYLMRSEKYYDD